MTALFAMLTYLRAFLIARHRLAVEAVALRQQLAVYKRKQPGPSLNRFDRLFLGGRSSDLDQLVRSTHSRQARNGGVLASRRIPLFWKWRSRRRPVGRPKVADEVRDLIRRMKRENPTWGAPRIHGESLALGFEISEPTV